MITLRNFSEPLLSSKEREETRSRPRSSARKIRRDILSRLFSDLSRHLLSCFLTTSDSLLHARSSRQLTSLVQGLRVSHTLSSSRSNLLASSRFDFRRIFHNPRVHTSTLHHSETMHLSTLSLVFVALASTTLASPPGSYPGMTPDGLIWKRCKLQLSSLSTQREPN